MKKPFKYWDALCVGIFFVVTALIFSDYIFSDNMLVSSDQMSGVGVRTFTRDSFFKDGQIPAWLSARLGGMPSIDAKFGDVFYPLTFVARPFIQPHRLHGFMMLIHVFIAGALFFLMMRRSFGAVRLVAFAGALFYMLSPQFVSHVSPGHDGKMYVIAWLPFVIWRLRSLLALPTLRNACIFAVSIGMVLLSGHVQMAYFVLMGVFLYWVTDIVKAMVAKEEKKTVVFKASFFWVGIFIGLGIGFIQLWPSYMFVKDAYSVRGIDRGFDFAASWAMNWAEFFSLWVHEFGNALEYYWGKNFFKLNTEYAGAIPLLLTFLAIASKPKSVWRVLWAGIAVLAVLFSLGANTPFFTLAYHTIPGVKRFRAPSMIMFWFTFSTAIMAAFFIKDLLGQKFNDMRGEQKKKWITGLYAALGAVTLLAALFSVESFVANFAATMTGGADAARVFKDNFDKNFVPNLWFWWFMAAVTLGMLAAVINGKLKPNILIYTLLILSTIDMVKVNSQFIKSDSKWKYYYRNDAALMELKAEFDRTPFRVFSLPGTFRTQNQEDAYGLEAVGGFHDNELNCYREFRGDQNDINYLADIAEISPDGQMRLSRARLSGNTPFLDLANVEYILTATGTGVGTLKNPTALGRLSYTSDFVVLPEGSIIGALRAQAYNYRTTVALLEEPVLPFTPQKDLPPSENQRINDTDSNGVINQQAADSIKTVDNIPKSLKAEWKKYTSNQRIAAITMPADGFLRLSEVYYPGWRIKANGVPVKYYRSDISWMAVPLKAGDYELIMEPKSLYLNDSIIVTLICVLFVAAVLAWETVRRKQKRQS